ncbi:MAG: ORF6N domain-containing protein [Gammaproteobacteria bacterium]|nr:MAG: ORF6N domain-containing protein [Gammaproteobacteria bacterium]
MRRLLRRVGPRAHVPVPNQGPLVAEAGIHICSLNQQVRRNRQRFPTDFLFELTAEEFSSLMLQNGDGLRISVDRRPIASHGGPQANECGGPEQERVGIGARPTATQHLSKQAAHGFDGVSGER